MGKPKSGWFNDSLRHSQARRFGKATRFGNGLSERRIGRGASVIAYKPLKAPLQSKSTDLPIQFRITVPSTTNKNEKLSPEEFQKRINQTAKELSSKFGGDTAIRGEGGYISQEGETKGQFIPEGVCIVETSMSVSDYKKNKASLAKYIKRKKRDWGQESVAYGLEGDLFIYPKFD